MYSKKSQVKISQIFEEHKFSNSRRSVSIRQNKHEKDHTKHIIVKVLKV